MTLFLIFQDILINLAIIVSLAHTFLCFMPETYQRCQLALADSLINLPGPRILHVLGKKLRSIPHAERCGKGCSSCVAGCNKISSKGEHTLKFQRILRK